MRLAAVSDGLGPKPENRTFVSQLHPVWPGLLLVVVACSFDVLMKGSSRWLLLWQICWLVTVTITGVYGFMIQYRIAQVLEQEPGWWGSYTPFGIVWRQLIPIYGLFVVYRWTKEIGSYLEWRLGRPFRGGLWAFLTFLAGVLMQGESPLWSLVGGLLTFVSFLFLYGPMRVAFTGAAPDRSLSRGTVGMV